MKALLVNLYIIWQMTLRKYDVITRAHSFCAFGTRRLVLHMHTLYMYEHIYLNEGVFEEGSCVHSHHVFGEI